ENNRYIGLLNATPVGEVLWPKRILLGQEWDWDPINQKFLRPDRLEDGLALPFLKTNGGFAALALFSTNNYTTTDVNLLRSYSKDLQRAYRTSQKLAAIGTVQTATEQALDQLDSGVALVDESGCVKFANCVGRSILSQNDGISLGRGGRVTIAERKSAAHLFEIIRSASRSNTRGQHRWTTSSPAGEVGGSLAIPRPSGGRPYAMVVVPARVPQVMGLPSGPAAVSCILFFNDPDLHHPIDATQVRAAYGLTPSQAVLVSQLVHGHRMRDAADSMGMTINSAKTLLQRAFDGCYVTRQSDLTALILRGPLGLLRPRE
ncbi:MAG TPA: hypothetical protein VLI93_09050, partial [Acetobacteraceae bacterium]|nr:hypothetical protein [Acetobacteraceae bacterium]